MPRVFNRRQGRKMQRLFPQTILHIDSSMYSDRFAKKMQEAGIRIWMNSLGDIDRAAEKGEDGFLQLSDYPYVNVIQTDLPERLIKHLKTAQLN